MSFFISNFFTIFVLMIGHDELWSYIHKNKKELKELGLYLRSDEISSGDRYYNEYGSQIILEVFGETYNVGYVNITEDNDDWAQAERYVVDWCRKKETNFDCKELYNILINYKTNLRDKKLNQLI